MRVAVMIVGLVLMIALFVQSCGVGIAGSLSNDESTTGGGAVGIVVAFLFLLGSAFAIGVPTLAMILFLLAGLLAMGVASSSGFSDLQIWGIISLVLAMLCFFSRREKRRKQQGQE